MGNDNQLAAALLELDAIAHRLRRDCPWDREQDERSIVGHTIEEAYELAESAHARDDAKLLDELGDVLYQVYFLALLLEERGAGDLASVARSCAAKLIRRHPHVFGSDERLEELPTQASTPNQVLRNWDEIKRREAGGGDPLGRVPEALPALLYARKVQKRGGFEMGAAASRLRELAERASQAELGRETSGHGSDEPYELVGELLFAVVDLSRALEVDPEVALRLRAGRFRSSVIAKRERQSTGGPT